MTLHLQLATAVINSLIAWASTHPEQAIGIVLAFAGSGYHYRKTGTAPIGRLPWREARAIFRELGDQYFGVKRPRGVPALVVDAPPEHVETALRNAHYESVDLYSYEYAGELANLRRPSGTQPHPTTGEPVPMETHPRTFKTSDGRTLVLCHDEASRFEATGLHLAETLMSWDRGRDTVAQDLDDSGFETEWIQSERQAGVDVLENPASAT